MRQERRDDDSFARLEGGGGLKDLDRCDDARGAAIVVARYAALRLLLRAMPGRTSDVDLAAERRAASEYIAAIGPPDDSERQALEPLVGLAGTSPEAGLDAALTAAAEAASARGHEAGAQALTDAQHRIRSAAERDEPPPP